MPDAPSSGPLPGKPREAATVDRLYALDGGLAIIPDRSEYSPGVDVGVPVALSCNCYLIRRGIEWLLWDTGLQDDLFFQSGGKVIAHNIRGIVSRTLSGQLKKLGLEPKDIGKVILSHAHFDHVGNCNMFPHATFYLQQLEHIHMFGKDYKSYGFVPSLYEAVRTGKVELLDGDTDLFGDRSLRVFWTPGHTPGHSSLLVNLRNSGPIMLSADVAHYRLNLEKRLVPKMNSSEEESQASMNKLEALCRDYCAKLWLNHDIEENVVIPHAPAWFD